MSGFIHTRAVQFPLTKKEKLLAILGELNLDRLISRDLAQVLDLASLCGYLFVQSASYFSLRGQF